MRASPKDRQSGLPRKYVPASLSSRDRAAQIRSIRAKRARPRVASFHPHKSGWTRRAHAFFKGDTSLRNIARVTGASQAGIRAVLRKGRGAYYSAGSRPNQTASSWARARLYSVLFGGKARTVDRAIVAKYKLPCLKCSVPRTRKRKEREK